MQKIIFLSVIILIAIAESKAQRQTVNNVLITVNVRKNYSTKKELILQDFVDVEYIALETKNDFEVKYSILQGFRLTHWRSQERCIAFIKY